MNSKINSIIIPAILAVALIATVGIMPATFAQNNTDMASEGGNMTAGMTQDGNMTQAQGGNMTTGMTQGQTADNGDDGDDGDDGDKDDKDKGE